MSRQYLILSLFLTTVAACSGSDPTAPPLPLPPSLDGTWYGASSGVTMRMVLAEEHPAISGSAVISQSSGPSAGGMVTGETSFPTFKLSFQPAGYIQVIITGTFVAEDTLKTELNGSGFAKFPLVFTKE